MAAYAVLFPERELVLLFPPVTFRAKTMLILSAVLAVAGIIFPMDNVANAAHLGGMLTGVVFIRRFVQGRGLPWEFHPDSSVPRTFASGPRLRQGSVLAVGGRPAG